MNQTVNAIVLHVQTVGDNDRLCTLLTEYMGVIKAFARGAKKINNRNFAATAQFVYGKFVLRKKNESWYILESDFEELYVPLRDDILKLALGQYLCELAYEFAPQDRMATDYLKLLRTALWLTAYNKRPHGVIKAATEMRMMSMAGYMPDLIMCSECGEYEANVMYFSPRTGTIRCGECGAEGRCIALRRGAMAALRHTIYVDLQRTYAFALEQESLDQLCAAAESYLLERTERSYPALDFYKSLL